MEIIFREMHHTYDETAMGHKIWFPDSVESDVISATANCNGFTPLIAITKRYGWNLELIKRASAQCNQRGDIAVLDHLSPKLLLVPSTKGKMEANFLVTDLINASNAIAADVLNFTHYGFIQSRLAVAEITSILKILLDPKTSSSIRVVVWDIDSRFKRKMISIWDGQRALTTGKPTKFAEPKPIHPPHQSLR